jgi:hypothetical protein
MSNNKIPEKPEISTAQTVEGLKRRVPLLSGSSLIAASALSAVGLTSSAQAPSKTPHAAAVPQLRFLRRSEASMISLTHRRLVTGARLRGSARRNFT